MNRLYQWHKRGKCSYSMAELCLIHHAMTGAGDGEKINAVAARHYLSHMDFNICALAAGWLPGKTYGDRPHLYLPLPADYNADALMPWIVDARA